MSIEYEEKPHIYVGINSNYVNLSELRDQYSGAYSNLLGVQIEKGEILRSVTLPNLNKRNNIPFLEKTKLMELGVNRNYDEFYL